MEPHRIGPFGCKLEGMSPIAVSTFVLLCLLAPTVVNAGVYKWVDEDGRAHYSDRPASQMPSERVTIQAQPVVGEEPSMAVPSADRVESEFAGKKAKKPVDILMYATQSCGYCRKARALFTERGVAWREVDIESSEQAKQEFKDRGGKGVPLIFINGRTIRGFNEEKLRLALGHYGY